MNNIKLSYQTERLRPLIKDLLLYSNISDATIEIGPRRTLDRGVFVNETEFENLEDIMSEVALQLYDPNVHNRHMPSTVVWLLRKYSLNKASNIASVIEKAIQPDEFFSLERYRL